MWAELANAVIVDVFGLYGVPDAGAFQQKKEELIRKLGWLLRDRTAGPFYAGKGFSLVDAAYGPIFRLIDIIEQRADPRVLEGVGLDAYRAALRARSADRSSPR